MPAQTKVLSGPQMIAVTAFMQDQGGTVTVSLKSRGNDAVFEVKDNGPGIPDELQPQLFERFRRADTGRSRETGSTGLGLAIVRGIVDAHGGRVSVSSKPGKTVFTVEIPKMTAPAA